MSKDKKKLTGQSELKPDKKIMDKLQKTAKDNELSCAVAFQIAKDIQADPADIGKTADLLNIRLAKCQLGLFGYKPEKKIVKPEPNVDPEIEESLRKELADGKLSCENAWAVASRHNIPKLKVGNICEALGIKIGKCQLGAF